jgi:hypothetical protein
MSDSLEADTPLVTEKRVCFFLFLSVTSDGDTFFSFGESSVSELTQR